MRPFVLTVAFVLIPLHSSRAATLDVPGQYPTIGAALAASSEGDVVLVSPGTYVENLTIPPHALSLHSSDGPEVTVIQAAQSGLPVIGVPGPGNAPHIRGFTITGGDAPRGSAIRFGAADGVVEDCMITGNRGTETGAVYVDGSRVTLQSCTFVDNVLSMNGSGGAIFADHFANVTVRGCIIARNRASNWAGAAVAISGSTIEFDHCTIVSNSSGQYFGAIVAFSSSRVDLRRSILAWNTSGGIGGFSHINIECSDVFGNVPSNYEGPGVPQTSAYVLSVDPQFCDLMTLDLGIAAASPCADYCGDRLGAGEVACGFTSTTGMTWGQVKARYR